MRKVIIAMAAMLLSFGAMQAQNTFKGIIKYKVESTGEVAFQIPAEAATAEIKVNGDRCYTKSAIFMSSPFSEENAPATVLYSVPVFCIKIEERLHSISTVSFS